MRPTDLRRSLRTLLWTLFAGYVAALIISVSALLVFNHFDNAHAAQLLSASVRNEIVTGDFRSAIVTLAQSVPSEFSEIRYSSASGAGLFSVPPRSAARTTTALTGSVSEQISIDAGSPAIGRMVFYFSRTRGLPFAFAVWLGLLLITFPLIRRARTQILRQYQNDIESRQNAALAQLASQLAHDIRSPLAALTMASRDLSPLPEETRVLLSSAVHRINDIANQLMRKPPTSHEEKEGRKDILLPAILDSMISEKRLEYRIHDALQIDDQLDSAAYGLFVHAEPTELKRIISNLMNNAIEAGSDRDLKVGVELQKSGDWVELSIRDTGRGISPELLPKLGRRGETHGKAGGSGLGLYHARVTLESWGGSLLIQSDAGRGTCVTLRFPPARTPAWFVESLILPNEAVLAVTDDDPLIHRIWKERIRSFGARGSGISLIHFSNPRTLMEWMNQNGKKANSRFLVDYEFKGEDSNGLDLISQLEIADRAMLVTSRYEEPKLLERCSSLGVRLIPKGMASRVPIVISGGPSAIG